LRLPGRATAAAVVILLMSAAVTSGVIDNRKIVQALADRSQLDQIRSDAPIAMPPGAVEAGRWLRAHSHPRDVVATNSHCRRDVVGCDSRDFWLAAFSERTVVVEGWSYTEAAFATGGLWDFTLSRSKFWDQPLLAANDAVFYAPTEQNVRDFTGKHRVRWLVAVDNAKDPTGRGETRRPVDHQDLSRIATERYRSGDVTVYQVAG
jgi:hypothetical protein